MNIMGSEILVLTGYFLAGGDLSSPINREILLNIEDITRGGNIPFILGLDANFKPAKWDDYTFPWLDKLNATIRTPDDSDHTCRGNSKCEDSLIDYFIISVRIQALIKHCRLLKDTPWGPHYGILLTINAHFDQVLAMQLTKPDKKKNDIIMKVEQAEEDAENANKLATKTNSASELEQPLDACNDTWDRAIAAADFVSIEPKANPHQQTSNISCNKYAKQLGITEVAHQLGHGLAVWGTAMNNYFTNLSLKDRDDDGKNSKAFKACPKGAFPEFRLKPVLEPTKQPLNSIILPGGGNLHTRIWRTVLVWMRILSKAKAGKQPAHGNYAASRPLSFANADDNATEHTLATLPLDDRRDFITELHIIIDKYITGYKPDIAAAADMANRFAFTALDKGRETCKKNFHEWICKALKKGAGQAHSWSNRPNSLPPLQLTTKDEFGNFEVDPRQVAEHHAKPWSKEWGCSDTIKFGAEITAIKNIRDKHTDDAPDWAETIDMRPQIIRKCCKTFPGKTAIGMDNIFFNDIAILPDNALVNLATLLRQCIAQLALPIQVLMQLMVLLGKKSGGSRTMAILSTLYRLLMRLLSADITDWDITYAGHWDSALKGNSSLRAHIARAMEIELADFEELFIIHFLWDMRKFYDSIRATKLIPLLTERGYPVFTMVLGLITHKSPRTLLVGTSCSEPLSN